MAKVVLASPQKAAVRRTRDFPPTQWGDFFIRNVSLSENEKMIKEWKEEAEALKEEVRKILKEAVDNPSQQLPMIDAIQRLNLSYHFRAEIAQVLDHIYNTYHKSSHDDDLCSVALRFRLLRHNRYDVSTDVFRKFKDGEGKFRESLKSDVRGMLSLYEASYIGFHGESILDEALQFTKRYLKSIVNQLKPPLFDLVSHALRWPVHRAVPCQEALDYVFIYEKEEGHVDCILRLGKLNFNILQKLWQEELYILTRWWIDLDLPSRLSFGRDRLVECFFWAIGSFPEPQHARARKYLTQFYAIFVYVDDTYDVHGTIDELAIFTKAFERADSSMGGELPHYMHIIVQSTLDLYDEIAQETTKEQSAYCVAGAKEAVAQMAKAYNDEAKWFNDGYVPKLDEYLLVGSISSAYPMGVTVSTCGLGEMATKQVFDWLRSMPKILHASATACRIRDDTRTHEFEQKRGDVASTVECYMNEHGVSEQEAINFLENKMMCLWKDMNEELLKPSTRDIPLPVVDNIINHTRVLEVVYEKDGGLTFPKNVLHSVIMDLVINPLDV